MSYRPFFSWARWLALPPLLIISFIADGCDKPVFQSVDKLTQQVTMPDPLTMVNHRPVTSMLDWQCRRQQLQALLSYYEYGQYPPQPDKVWGDYYPNRQQLLVHIEYHHNTVVLPVKLILPSATGHFPAFIEISRTAIGPLSLNKAGMAYLTFEPSVIATDDHDLNGQRISKGLLYDLYGTDIDTGVLMAWAWATHRIIDALQDVPQIDGTKIAVNGFSRWGKAALLAGAYDQRIDLTVPSSSGQAAVGNFRSAQGHKDVQTLDEIIDEAPQWFSQRFIQFKGHTELLPVDSNELVSLIAPRAIIATEGMDDRWDYPAGIQQTMERAKQVFEFLHVADHIGFKLSSAVGHTMTEQQQQDILLFARHFLLNQPVGTDIFDHPYTSPADSSVAVSSHGQP